MSNSGTPEAKVTDVVIVTGLSGAGRSSAAKALEDLGWYVADNMPPELISRMLDLVQQSAPLIKHLAVVLDVRSPFFTGDLNPTLAELEGRGVRARVLFLEASDAELVKRFGFARRRHPLQDDEADSTLAQGISEERSRLSAIKDVADLVIDTSELSIHQLRRQIESAYGASQSTVMHLTVQSFGFKYGLPLDADVVLDVRFLPNPHWVPELRPHTGLEVPVRDYVMAAPTANDYLEHAAKVVEVTMNGYRSEGKHYMMVAVGCTGGRHRSVAVAEAIGHLVTQSAQSEGGSVRVVHRDLNRE